MKKLLLLIITFAIISSGMFAAGINVKKPDGIGEWYAGSKYNIKWSIPSRLPMKVDIHLLTKSKAVVMNIAKNVDFRGNGSFPWFIPMTTATGEFYIRVSNKMYSGTSRLFTIDKLHTGTLKDKTKNVKLPSHMRKNLKIKELPDFKIYDIKCTTTQRQLVFNVENLGARYVGNVKLHYKVGNDSGVLNQHVSMSKGTRGMFPTNLALGISHLNSDKKSVTVAATVDWDGIKGFIPEMNEKNNSVYKSIYPDLGFPDFDITGLEFVKTGNSSSNPQLPRGHFRVKVKNLWSSCNICTIALEIYYRFESEPVLGHPRRLPVSPSVETDLEKNEEAWYNTLDFDWPERNPGVKENIWFKVCVWNYIEQIRDNNCSIKLINWN